MNDARFPLTNQTAVCIVNSTDTEVIMDETIRFNIRHIFLSPRPTFVLMTAASLLGMSFPDLKREIEDGSIVAVSTRLGARVPREEMMAAAMGCGSSR